MSLASQIADDVADVFQQVDDFAETITYFPKEGKPRSIVVTRVSLSFYRRQRQEHIEEEQHHQVQVEELAFFIKNHAVLGMTNPQLGDAIRLSTDRSAERWDFVSVEESDVASFVVAWQKSTLRRAGKQRPPRL